jgi:hypothetical protein
MPVLLCYLKKLTGENHQITEMTYDEIKKLKIKKQLIYGMFYYYLTVSGTTWTTCCTYSTYHAGSGCIKGLYN